MVDRGAAERACKDANPIIDGRKANVNLAYLGAKPRSSQTSKCVGSLVNTEGRITRSFFGHML